MRDLLRRLAAALASGDVRRTRADQAHANRLAHARADREWQVHQWLAARAAQIEQAGRG